MKLLKSALIQMGGGVAGDFAQTCPEAVKSLVMVGAVDTVTKAGRGLYGHHARVRGRV